jgi:serine/threonine-protein kinase
MLNHVIGNYQIQALIGEGGMGAVFKGFDLMLERDVAVKVLLPELARQPQLVERFRAEAVTLARLNHPYVATLHTLLRHGEELLMVMEFVRGETLEAVLRRHGALTVSQALRLFGQVLEGIAHAHQLGIVHRDLKPANLMLTENGTVKVMDFGIARLLGSARMTRTGRIVGTLAYMSPEQVRGQETDARSDIYALGIVLYELLTGHVPFQSDSEYELMHAHLEVPPPPLRQFAAHIPVVIEQLVLRALAKDPAQRFQTVMDFHAALLNAARVVGLPLAPLPSDVTPIVPAHVVAQRTPSQPSGDFRQAGLADQLIKETRLAQASGAYAQPQYNAPVVSPAAQFIARLNWKHYASAAAALVAVVSAFFLFTNKQQPASAPPAVNQTISVQPTPAPTAEVVEQVLPPAALTSAAPVPIDQPASFGPPQAVDSATAVGAPTKRAQPARKRRTDAAVPPTIVVVQPTPLPTAKPSAAAVRPQPTPATAALNAEEERKREKERKKQEKEASKENKEKRIIEAAGGIWDIIRKKKN